MRQSDAQVCRKPRSSPGRQPFCSRRRAAFPRFETAAASAELPDFQALSSLFETFRRAHAEMAAPFIDGCALSGLHSQPLIKRILNRTQKKSSIKRAGLACGGYANAD